VTVCGSSSPLRHVTVVPRATVIDARVNLKSLTSTATAFGAAHAA
jgi:hypothetical protein